MAGNPGNLGMALNSKPDLNLDFLGQATDKFFSSSASSSRESLPQAGEMSSEASGIPGNPVLAAFLIANSKWSSTTRHLASQAPVHP